MAGTMEEKSPLTTPPRTGRDRAKSRWITVEPVIVLGMVGNACITLVRPLFVKETIKNLHNYTDGNETHQCGATNYSALDDEIQAEASMWLLYLGLASGIPAMLSTIIFSTSSDRLGRKIAMALPITGTALQSAVYGFTVHFQLPLPVLLVGEVIQGLSGGFGLLFAACISYLTDATSPKQRTIRIVVAEMLTFFVAGLSQIGEGYLIKNGYLLSLSLAAGVTSLTLLYIIMPFTLIETIDKETTIHKTYLEVLDSMRRVMIFNKNGRRWQMLLLDFFIFSCVSQFAGVSAIFVLYGTAKPFCWTSSTAGIAIAVVFMTGSVGMLVGTKLFSLCFGDYWLMQIGCLSLFAGTLVTGFAQSTLVIFLGAIPSCLRGLTIPVARSVLSKIAHPDEIGAIFSIVGCLEALSSVTSGLVATSLYASTVQFLPSLTFFVFAGVTVIPAGITLILQIFWPRHKEYVPLSTPSSESIN